MSKELANARPKKIPAETCKFGDVQELLCGTPSGRSIKDTTVTDHISDELEKLGDGDVFAGAKGDHGTPAEATATV